MKFMINTLSTMMIIQKLGHAYTNIWPRFGKSPETIKHLYQCMNDVSRGTWTASIDAFVEMDRESEHGPRHLYFFVNALLYIAREVNDLPQCPNLNIYYGILSIGWPYTILGFIPKYLALTHQMYLTHIGSKKNRTQMGHPTHHTNLETNLRPMDTPQ